MKPIRTADPTRPEERYPTLDAIRGIALFGVLMVNLLTGFRVSLFRVIAEFHTDPGWWNHAVDFVVAATLEFKAITLFSLLFGAGMAIQAERRVEPGGFLVRRFVVLLGIGLAHIVLVWNGDILALYAVCGLLAIPALRVYPHEGYGAILLFRAREARGFILPLLLSTLPRTLGLMLWGAAIWRSRSRTSLLRPVALIGGLTGGALTIVHVWSEATRRSTVLPDMLVDLGSLLPLALAYGAVLILWAPNYRGFVALGRMALTNYLTQSIVLSLVFYGYGLGLFGRLGSAEAAVIGIALYLAQMWFSQCWLMRFRFGPAEWLWRSFTYGAWV